MYWIENRTKQEKAKESGQINMHYWRNGEDEETIIRQTVFSPDSANSIKCPLQTAWRHSRSEKHNTMLFLVADICIYTTKRGTSWFLQSFSDGMRQNVTALQVGFATFVQVSLMLENSLTFINVIWTRGEVNCLDSFSEETRSKETLEDLEVYGTITKGVWSQYAGNATTAFIWQYLDQMRNFSV